MQTEIERFKANAENQTNKTASAEIALMGLERYELLKSSDGRAGVRDAGGAGKPGAVRMFGGDVERALRVEYAADHGKPPASGAIRDASELLEGWCFGQPAQAFELRFCDGTETVSGSPVRIVDVNETEEAHIYPGGWELVSDTETPASPAWMRPDGMREMTVNADGGGIADVAALFELLNIEEDDQPAVLAWLVCALLGRETPVLLFRGPQGAGKSTAARVLARLLDDNATPIQQAPNKPEGVPELANSTAVLALDNLSRISPDMSDVLCQLVTGMGHRKRALYTDDQMLTYNLRRPIILTSIDTGTIRGDLADRTLLVGLKPVSTRMLTADIEATFADLAPRIRHGIYSLAGAVMGVSADELGVTEMLPRMGDFGTILAAVDDYWGDYEGFYRYLAALDELQSAAVLSDPWAERLVEFVKEQQAERKHGDAPAFRGSPAALRDALGEAPANVHHWPASAQEVSGKLKRLEPSLLREGVRYTATADDKHRKGRFVLLEWVGDEIPAAEAVFKHNRNG